MTWTKIYGPEQFDVCGDDALYEIGSVYGNGTPDSGGQCREEAEVVYYVITTPGQPTADQDTWGVRCMTHLYSRDAEGEVTGLDEDYEYDWGCALCYWTFESAKARADELANMDESWMFTSPARLR